MSQNRANLNNFSNEDLMVLYQNGDDMAFEILYRRNAPRVLGYLKSKLRNHTSAEDVLQLAFLKLHSSRALYDSKLQFLPWLFTISRSVLFDHLRKDKKYQSQEPIDAIEVASPFPIENKEISEFKDYFLNR